MYLQMPRVQALTITRNDT